MTDKKYVSKCPKEKKRRVHSVVLNTGLVEDYNYLCECVSKSDANVTGSDKSVQFFFGSNTTLSRLHLSATSNY
jgi:hypothetical protein